MHVFQQTVSQNHNVSIGFTVQSGPFVQHPPPISTKQTGSASVLSPSQLLSNRANAVSPATVLSPSQLLSNCANASNASSPASALSQSQQLSSRANTASTPPPCINIASLLSKPCNTTKTLSAATLLSGSCGAGSLSTLLSKPQSSPISPHSTPTTPQSAPITSINSAAALTSTPKSAPCEPTVPLTVLTAKDPILGDSSLLSERGRSVSEADIPLVSPPPLVTRALSERQQPSSPSMYKVAEHPLASMLLRSNASSLTSPTSPCPSCPPDTPQSPAHIHTLVDLLGSSQVEDQCNAANSMANLALKESYQLELMQDYSFSKIIDCSYSPSPDVQRFIALSLFRLAQQSTLRRRFVDEKRALPALVNLTTSTRGTVWRQGARTLAVLSFTSDIRPKVSAAGGLESIQKLAQSEQTEFQADAFRSLSLHAQEPGSHAGFIVGGALQLNLDLAMNKKSSLRLHAGNFLQTLVRHAVRTGENQSRLQQPDVIQALCALTASRDPYLVKIAACSLARLIAGAPTPHIRKQIASEASLAPIFSLAVADVVGGEANTAIVALCCVFVQPSSSVYV